ncbi:MAG: PTS system mannose/fructose/sorbose family transporter subunit IID [Tissierellia bacterium]|nr:PTS system mannose/fructose/sorbose family transporter subunit IID [Tissierellia bacterium]
MEFKKLKKKDYIKASLRAYLMQNGFNYSNYQGTGYANQLRPALKKIYADDKDGYKEAMISNLDFYNTNPQLVPFVSSVQLVMEENKVDKDQIRDMKMALMGPLAGIGDSISQFLLAPLLSTIFASMAADGTTIAPVLFFITINAILLALKLSMGLAGYKTGMSVVGEFSDKMKKITTSASIVGVAVISALVTQFVKIYIPISYVKKIGEETQNVSIQSMIDGIAPKLLPVLWTALVYYLVKKKKWTTYKVIILTVLIAIIASAIGIISPIAPVVE